ncbi:hypothetical protein [Tamaricihabitans halophyticus]|uniref:hypothetical protein n=1 Tax=Tamaricihabitans halophyticus TaxID=1262583 RepID=UPI0010435389|nr:hypothetical protein [Tamaricihabitans halophyticus]
MYSAPETVRRRQRWGLLALLGIVLQACLVWWVFGYALDHGAVWAALVTAAGQLGALLAIIKGFASLVSERGVRSLETPFAKHAVFLSGRPVSSTR